MIWTNWLNVLSVWSTLPTQEACHAYTHSVSSASIKHRKPKKVPFQPRKDTSSVQRATTNPSYPIRSVFKLHRYFEAGKVTAVVKDLQNAQEQENMMNICRRCRMKNNSVAYCFDCTMPMCGDCLLKHNQRTANEAHMAITVTAKTISVLICKFHREFVEDFCSQCFTFACSTCHKTVDKGHKFRSFTMQHDTHNTNFLQKIDKEVKYIDIILQSVAQIKDDSYMLVSAQMKRLSISFDMQISQGICRRFLLAMLYFRLQHLPQNC